MGLDFIDGAQKIVRAHQQQDTYLVLCCLLGYFVLLLRGHSHHHLWRNSLVVVTCKFLPYLLRSVLDPCASF